MRSGRIPPRAATQLASRYVCLAVAVAACWAATTKPLRSQVELIEPEAPKALLTDSFLTLTGAGCAVRFTPGALDRAHHLLRRLEVVTSHLNRWGEIPVPTAVYLLNREEWQQAGLPGVYGIPIRVGPTALASAALGDQGTVQLWKALLGDGAVPLSPGVPLVGTEDEAATMAIADVLLQVETARGFVQRAGMLGAEAWIGELVSHVAALVIFRLHEEARLPEIVSTFERLRSRLGGDRVHAANAFSPALNQGVTDEVRQWLWFQATFQQGALMILEKDGKGAIGRLRKLSRKGGGSLREEDLRSRYHGLAEWLSNGFAP